LAAEEDEDSGDDDTPRGVRHATLAEDGEDDGDDDEETCSDLGMFVQYASQYYSKNLQNLLTMSLFTRARISSSLKKLMPSLWKH
jgi:hypothetical protein